MRNRIDDRALLRHGAMGKLFGRPYAPSTLGSFLRKLRLVVCRIPDFNPRKSDGLATLFAWRRFHAAWLVGGHGLQPRSIGRGTETIAAN